METGIGWVGVRGYGERFFEEVKQSVSGRIVGCYHPDPEVALAASKEMRCLAHSDYQQLLGQDGLRAVILTLPNQFHFSFARDALLADKHVLVEKPLTNTYAEGLKLVELAERKNLVLGVGHNYRFMGYVQAMKGALDEGRIGRPVAAEFNMGHGGGFKFVDSQWRFHREKCPGGPLNMLGSHQIDTANYLFGTVKDFSGSVQNLYADTTAEDMSLIRIEYQSGVIVSITNLYNSVSTEFINLYGTDGALRFNRWPECGLWFQPKDISCDCAAYERIDFSEASSAKLMFDEFVKATNGVDSDMVSGRFALETVRIIDAILGLSQ